MLVYGMSLTSKAEVNKREITPKIVGSTAIYNFSSKDIEIESLSFEQWGIYVGKIGGEIISKIKNEKFYIAITKLQRGYIVVHVHNFKEDKDYNYSVSLTDGNNDYISTKIVAEDSINFNQVLLNNRLISDGVSVRFDKIKKPVKAQLVINVKGENTVNVELNLSEVK
jgi:hypothetical protein